MGLDAHNPPMCLSSTGSSSKEDSDTEEVPGSLSHKTFDICHAFSKTPGLIRLIFKVFYHVLSKHGFEAADMVTGRGPVHMNGLLLCYCMASSRPGESEPSSYTLNNLPRN